MTIKIELNQKGTPVGQVATAELVFGPEEGDLLNGLKLIGFGVWARRTGGGYNVVFPARQYSVNGERRSFALLRPSLVEGRIDAQDPIRQAIIAAYLAEVEKG